MPFQISQIQKCTSPNLFALVSTRKEDGSTNLMALSWWTYAPNHPETIALCISKKSYSGERIRATNEFGLNIVDESLKEAAFLCGTCSGRAENKPEKYGEELIDASTMETKLVKAHKTALECRVVQSLEVADHILYIAEITEAHCIPENRQLFALNGYSALGTVLSVVLGHFMFRVETRIERKRAQRDEATQSCCLADERKAQLSLRGQNSYEVIQSRETRGGCKLLCRAQMKSIA